MEAADWPLLKGAFNKRGRMRAQGVMEKNLLFSKFKSVFLSVVFYPPDPTLAAVRVKGHKGRTDEKTTQNVTGMKKVFRQKLAEESSGCTTGN